MSDLRILDPGEYTVGWICALSTEYVAAQMFLQEEHGQPKVRSRNDGIYKLGAIHGHNVVITLLPMGEYGTASAASTATNMLRSFPNIRIGLMVGIGGCAPSPQHDIRLGDIVVSVPEDGHAGVFQFDFGKSVQGQDFRPTRALSQPPQAVLTAVGALRARHLLEENGLFEAAQGVLDANPRLRKKGFQRPSLDTDILFPPDFVHIESPCVSICGRDPANRVHREQRPDDDPEIHYGTIASANTVMKDAELRDVLAPKWKILCFEMEAAGLMNRFPCLAIRGICDYSDSHKSKDWQGYAALVAAAYAQSLLETLRPEAAMLERTLQSIVDDVAETKHAVVKIGSQQHTAKELKMLGWLSDSKMPLEQDNTFAQRQRGTGKWFLNSYQYRNWVKGHGQILFCPGIPGAGKTTLSSIVIDDLKTRFDGQLDVGLAFFYCKFNNQDKQTIRSLQASLLKQLCQRQPRLPDNIISLFEKHERDETSAQDREVAEALHIALETCPRIFVVIDALDEWQNTEADRSGMIEAILSLRERFQVNILATARPLEDIKQKFPGSPSLEITAAEEDIALYIDGHLGGLEQVLSRSPRGPQVKDEMKRSLHAASKGMFLSAQLHLKALITHSSIRNLEDMLKKLLAGTEGKEYSDILEETYDATMVRIRAQDNNSKELALEVLSWISLATRALRVDQLQHAVAFQYGDTKLDKDGIVDVGRMISVCCGLVEVDDSAHRRIRLIHYTTHVYFRSHPVQWPPDAQSNIARKCVGYLSLCGLEYGTCQVHEKTARWDERWFQPPLRGTQPPRDVSFVLQDIRHWSITHPLSWYAADNWGHHARKVTKALNDTTDEIILDFLKNRWNLPVATTIALPSEKDCNPFTVNGLHLAAHFGLDELLLRLLEVHAITAQDSRGRTALSWAARAGHESTVEIIIDKLLACQALNLNERTSQSGETPLFLAVCNRHTAVMELLLRRGANTEARDSRGWTPAAQATRSGNCAAVERLLHEKASQEQQVSYAEQTLLDHAINAGQDKMVLLLLNKGVDVNSRDGTGMSALSRAIWKRNQGLVKLFLNWGADINVPSYRGYSPLMEAVASNQEELGIMLVEKGAALHFEDEEGRTAFDMAYSQGLMSLWKLLNERGAPSRSGVFFLDDEEAVENPLDRCNEPFMDWQWSVN